MNPIDVINSIIPLNEDNKKILLSSMEKRDIKKGVPIINEGEKNNLIGFISSGLFRSYLKTESGEQLTLDFFQMGSFFTDLNSYYLMSQSKVNVEAVVDSTVFFLDRKTITELYKLIPEFYKFEIIYKEKISLCLLSFQKKINHLGAYDSYKLFSKTYKQALCESPKKYIASFLGISPFTLSRIKL